MFKSIATSIALAIAVVLGYAALQPDSFRVQRSAAIKAPPERVYGLIADLRQWTAWSPWEKKDPAMKRSYGGTTGGGTASGKGASYAWEGNKDVGQGSMEITEAVAPSKIVMDLRFVKPFEARNTTEFVLQPAGDTTNVTWAMHGPSPFISKLMGVFVDMDKMIGADFEAGLANLKAVSEKPAEKPAQDKPAAGKAAP